MNNKIVVTRGGDGYSAATGTLFVNRTNATSVISRMVSDAIERIKTTGFTECWKCDDDRPFDAAPCAYCGADITPF